MTGHRWTWITQCCPHTIGFCIVHINEPIHPYIFLNLISLYLFIFYFLQEPGERFELLIDDNLQLFRWPYYKIFGDASLTTERAMGFRSEFDRLNKWHEFWVLAVFIVRPYVRAKHLKMGTEWWKSWVDSLGSSHVQKGKGRVCVSPFALWSDGWKVCAGPAGRLLMR